MNLVLLYGDNLKKVSERLTKFVDVAKKRGWRVERVEKDSDLSAHLRAQSLFPEERLFILESPKSLSKRSLAWLSKTGDRLEGNLILVEFGELGAAFIKSLPKDTKKEHYEIPKKIWNFLDIFAPGDPKKVLRELAGVLEKEPAELVSAILARHLRDLYMAKLYPEKLALPLWRRRKIMSQAAKFTEENLAQTILDLAAADYDSKRGFRDLSTSLDLIIAGRLE